MLEAKKIDLGLFGLDVQTPEAALNVNTSGVNQAAGTVSGGLSPQMRAMYLRRMLEIAKPKLYYNQFGQKTTIEKRGGYQAQWRRYSKLPKAITPLVEGVTPSGGTLSVTEVRATVRQYGAYVSLSDYSDLTAIDNNIAGASELCGAQAGETLDTITRDVLCATTSVQYGDGKKASDANLTVSDVLSVNAIMAAVRTLRRNSAEKIGDSFVAIIHPDCSMDIMNDARWQSVKDYDSKDFYEGEIGKIGGVRFVESPEAKVEGSSETGGVAIYHTLIFGANAYGTVDIDGGQLEHIFKGFGSGGTSDPLDQRATVGWKASHAAAVLCPEWLVDVHTASSLNPADSN